MALQTVSTDASNDSSTMIGGSPFFMTVQSNNLPRATEFQPVVLPRLSANPTIRLMTQLRQAGREWSALVPSDRAPDSQGARESARLDLLHTGAGSRKMN